MPLFLCPLRRRGTNYWRVFWAVFGGCVCRQPPPANPLLADFWHLSCRGNLLSKCLALVTLSPQGEKSESGPFRTPQKNALGQESPKSLQKVILGLPGQGCQKSVEKVPTDPKKSPKGVEISVWGLFRLYFDTPARKARDDLSETLRGFRAQRASGLLYMAVPIVTRK